MKPIATFILLVVSMLALASCASLTKEECLSSDWQLIGQRDGAQGNDPQWQFRRHTSACKKVNVVPDHARWRQGFNQGLVQYCTPIKGLRVGQQGKVYNNVCPAQSEGEFLRGYNLGKTENAVRSRISSLENQSNSLGQEIDVLLDQIASAKPTQIIVIKNEIKQKRFERDVMRDERQDEIYRLSRIEQVVEQFLQDPYIEYDPRRL